MLIDAAIVPGGTVQIPSPYSPENSPFAWNLAGKAKRVKLRQATQASLKEDRNVPLPGACLNYVVGGPRNNCHEDWLIVRGG